MKFRQMTVSCLPSLVLLACTMSISVHAQSMAQSTSSPVPNANLQFTLWQNSDQSTATSADTQALFKLWQGQRTSADSINLFKCTTSSDLDNPECVGKPPGTKITGTKAVKIPTTAPVRKSKTGDPD